MANEAVIEAERPSEPARCRQFGVSDAMILVAGAALALSADAHLLVLLTATFGELCGAAVAHGTDLPEHWPLFWRATHDHLRNTLWYGFQVTEDLLVGMTAAFFLLRVRKPRPALRVVVLYPGTAACLAMLFALFWGTGLLYYLFPDKLDSFTTAAIAVGGTVALVWCVLALSRRWAPEPGWIDGLGRALGCVAIGTALLGLMIFRI